MDDIRNIRTPNEVFELARRNPSGLLALRALFLWGFISYEDFVARRAVSMAQSFGVIVDRRVVCKF